jgi:hypothetical protein
MMGNLGAYHHWVEPTDYKAYGYASEDAEGFKQLLEKGSADVWVVNVETGEKKRISNAGAGKEAKYPNFYKNKEGETVVV